MTEEKNRVGAVNAVFLVSMVISVTVAFLPLTFLQQRPVLQLIFSQVILVLPSVVYMAVHKLSYAETVRFRKMKLADMAWTILLGILIQPLLTLLNALSMVVSTNTTSTFMLELTSQVSFLPALIFTAVVPCIFEETVYRGVFYNEYRKINPWKAALLSGFLFGLMHGNINQFCYAAVMGVLFAMVIEATGSILSTMLIHFWINAGSIVLMYLYPKLYEVMKAFYKMYVEYGNTEMAELLEQAFGDMTLSSAEWMQNLLTASAEVTLSVPEVLGMYAPQALIGGILAFLVYKKLAVRNDNWQRICGFFRRKSQEELFAEGMTQKKQRMITLPLAFAIALGVAFMIFYEIVVRMTV